MKELIIHVRINGSNTASIVKKNGFDDSVSTAYEVIGILQNLISLEQAKLVAKTTTMTRTENGKKKE